MSYRQYYFNDAGEPLGYDIIHEDDFLNEPDLYDDGPDLGYDEGDFDSGDDGPLVSWSAAEDGRYDDDPSPYTGTYSEE